MRELDQKLTTALDALGVETASAFDMQAYINAFSQSARDKAKSVLEVLKGSLVPFEHKTPVFVSVGGGDGEELLHLLNNSSATCGVLIEGSHPLVKAAVGKFAQVQGIETEVYGGDAQDKLEDAVGWAIARVKEGKGDFIAVTCHAVIHELFDRSDKKFDPLSFFGKIFADKGLDIFFTYREPGAPEKWPQAVLLKADCDLKPLLRLASAIRSKHRNLFELIPTPQIVGDHVYMHSVLAMEVLCKLFYLEDLAYEIQERSTAVEHKNLINCLWYAIGGAAKQDNRANIFTISQPSSSFIKLWQRYGIEVLGWEDSREFHIPIVESHTRVIAFRLSQPPEPTKVSALDLSQTRSDMITAMEALQQGDHELLQSLLISRGRAWIESAFAEDARKLFLEIRRLTQHDSLLFLWTHYLLSISELFAGNSVSAAAFPETLQEMSKSFGLEPLILAERMEFSRKSGQLDEAVTYSNKLIPMIEKPGNKDLRSNNYVLGVANFLVGNLLRHGGLYKKAHSSIEKAEHLFRPAIESEQTELLHCYYAKSVCNSMAGVSLFDLPMRTFEQSQRFAGALIRLTYSHAAWFINDIDDAINHAREAATSFGQIRFGSYNRRASDLVALLLAWKNLESRGEIEGNSPLLKAIKTIVGLENDLDWLSDWMGRSKPSVVLGTLQFQRFRNKSARKEMKLPLPRMMAITETKILALLPSQNASSLDEADELLRSQIGIEKNVRVPLIAD